MTKTQMFFFQYIGRVTVIFIFLIIYNSDALYNKHKKEEALTDVIKNITIANKILQDLLNSYKRLQKIYKSEDSVESGTLSFETEQSYQSSMYGKNNIEERSHKKYTTTKNPHIGTALIYASNSVEKDSTDTEEINKVSTDIKSAEQRPGDMKKKLLPSEEDFDTGIGNKHDFKDTFHNNENIPYTISGKNKAKFKDKERQKDSSEKTNQKSSSDSDEVEQIVIEIPDNVRSEEQRLSEKQSYPNKSIKKNIFGVKTRFSIQNAFPTKKYIRNNSELPLRINRKTSRRIKKVAYSDLFSPDKNRNEFINRPKNRVQRFFNNNNSIKTKNNQKITVLILTNNEKESGYRKEPQNQSNIKKRLLEIYELLRSDYGNTCLRMPIKKCKKAMKIVNKNICKRRFKCKSDFKSDFLEHSNNGCEKEFAYRELENKNETTIDIITPLELRNVKQKSWKNTGDLHNIDILPDSKLLEHFISLRNETPQDLFLRVRDKYEKKCQNQSTKKCINACNYALTETCKVLTCEKKKNKAVKLECKNQCKKAYMNIRNLKKSSDSESESDSDSDSDDSE